MTYEAGHMSQTLIINSRQIWQESQTLIINSRQIWQESTIFHNFPLYV